MGQRLPVGTLLMLLALSACSGGGSSSPSSAAPVNPASPAAPPAPVPAANRAPTIAGSPATSLTEGDTYLFLPTASDADGDPLTFSASGLPGWLTLDSSSGRLSGTAPVGSAGTYGGIVVSVTDGKASASLPAFGLTVLRAAPLGSAELSWSAPTRNEDGTALTDLAGYKVRYGQVAETLPLVLDVADPGATGARVEGLGTGAWYFSVTSYNRAGVESAPAGPVSTTVN